MQRSDSTSELTKALIKVQSQVKGARADSVNPFFKAKYASLASVWDACRKLLADNELAVVQTMSTGEGHKLIIDTTLLHSSGEWISGQLPMVLSKDDPQGIGQAITYGRRYGLSAIIGICPEDDDAEGSVSHKAPKPKAQATTNKPPEEPVVEGEKEFKNIGQLLTECSKFKIARQQVLDLIGVADPKEITDFNEAWMMIRKELIRAEEAH